MEDKGTEKSQKTGKNRETRICIAKALLGFMQEKDFESIRVTDIVKSAHVSRMTYYKYYSSKRQVLSDYLDELVMQYEKEAEIRADIGSFREYEHILFSLEFFAEYADFSEILLHSDLYVVFIDAINRYMDNCAERYGIDRYELYYYGGALCNIYLKWIEEGRKETPGELAGRIYKMTHRQKTQ